MKYTHKLTITHFYAPRIYSMQIASPPILFNTASFKVIIPLLVETITILLYCPIRLFNAFKFQYARPPGLDILRIPFKKVLSARNLNSTRIT